MNGKRCPDCTISKCRKDFSRHAGRADGLQAICKRDKARWKGREAEHYAKKKARREVTIAKVWEYLSLHPCIDCSEADPIVLEFDHVRGEKVMEISDMLSKGFGWGRISEEIVKCEVRCANCHRRRTAIQQGWHINEM